MSASDKVGATVGRREHDARTVVLMAQAAGIEKPPSPHRLRHTFGTLTAMAGAGVFSIQEAMGHAQITTSQRYVRWARGLPTLPPTSCPSRLK